MKERLLTRKRMGTVKQCRGCEYHVYYFYLGTKHRKCANLNFTNCRLAKLKNGSMPE